MEDSRARGGVKQNGQHQEAPGPSHKRAKTVQATLKRFFSSGGGDRENDDLTRVILEKTDKTKGRNRVEKTKYFHPPPPNQKDFPDYLPMHVVPLFLPPELADALKAELVEEAETMVSRERKVGGVVTKPLRLTKVVHNEEAEDPLNRKPAFAEATRLMEEYINRKKGNWAELQGHQRLSGPQMFLAAHSDTLAIIGDRPLIAGLNLGATRVFRLNLYRSPTTPERASLTLTLNRDYDFHIPHNCAYIMLPGCQENFKHSVPALLNNTSFPLHDGSEARYSITYRYQRWPIANVPPCDHGNPANLHVVHKGNKVGSYLWRCDWTNSNNTGAICNFRKTYTGDPRGAGGGKQEGGGGGGKVPTPQSWEAGGALEMEGGEGEDRKVSPQEHQQEEGRQEEEEEEQQVEEGQQRDQKAVEIVVVEDDVDEEGEEEQQQQEPPVKAPARHGEVIVIDDDDDDE